MIVDPSTLRYMQVSPSGRFPWKRIIKREKLNWQKVQMCHFGKGLGGNAREESRKSEVLLGLSFGGGVDPITIITLQMGSF